jgi:hypothetical protein
MTALQLAVAQHGRPACGTEPAPEPAFGLVR